MTESELETILERFSDIVARKIANELTHEFLRKLELNGNPLREPFRTNRFRKTDELKTLNKRIESKQKELAALTQLILDARRLVVRETSCDLPAIPEFRWTQAKAAEAFPCSPGIYFAMRGNQCDYIGKSVNLSQRIKNHEFIRPDQQLTFLLFPEPEIHHAELYYIWKYKPALNGQSREAIASIARTLCDS